MSPAAAVRQKTPHDASAATAPERAPHGIRGAAMQQRCTWRPREAAGAALRGATVPRDMPRARTAPRHTPRPPSTAVRRRALCHVSGMGAAIVRSVCGTGSVVRGVVTAAVTGGAAAAAAAAVA